MSLPDASPGSMVAAIMLFWRPAGTGQMVTEGQAGRECPEAQARREPSDHIVEPGTPYAHMTDELPVLDGQPA